MVKGFDLIMNSQEKISLKGKRVFISGGAGVIGRALVDILEEQGAVILVGDLKPRPSEWKKSILYRRGDLNYIKSEELKFFEPEYFFHLAATFERSIETYEFWNQNFHNNVMLSHHLMDCLKECKTLKKVVFASSYLVYDPDIYQSDIIPDKPIILSENSRIQARNTCGAAKLFHEVENRFLTGFNQINFDVISARIFRVYGRGSNDIISRWIRLLMNNKPIEVYHKENYFDYIFADEVANGLIQMAIKPYNGIINLGNGKARRISEVIDVLKKYFPEIKINYTTFDDKYESSQANMDLCQNICNWISESQIEDNIPKIIEYEKNIIRDPQEVRNILITSISSKIPLIERIKNAKNKMGLTGRVFGGDSNATCIGKYFVDEFWEMPEIEKISTDSFLSFCKEKNIFVIIPTRDGELTYFAERKEEFWKARISIMISPLNTIKICHDKLEFYKFCIKNNIPTIHTTENIDKITNTSRFVVKERYGAGSRKIGLNLSKHESIEHAKLLKNPIFQPFVEGKEYTIDVYSDKNGRIKGCIPRRRNQIVNGESQISQTEKNAKLEAISSDLVQKIKSYGHCNIQAFYNKNESFDIIECNCRIGGASSLSMEAGLDSIYWFLLESSNEDLTDYPFIRSEKEKMQIRHTTDFYL